MFHRILKFGLFAILIFLSFDILKYFFTPVLWAMIIAYITHPIYQWIKQRCWQKENISICIMLLGITFILGLPVIFGLFFVQHQGYELFVQVQQQLATGTLHVPDQLSHIPIVGAEIVQTVDQINQNPHLLTTWLKAHLSYGHFIFAQISQQFAKLFLTLLSLFFFYKYGNLLVTQFKQALFPLLKKRTDLYIKTIADTTRAVVYGFGLTALAQAILTGLSYYVAKAPHPLLLSVITFVCAFIPFGAPVAYTGVSLWLFMQGHTIPAIGVLAWGVCIVSTSENLLRPFVISGTAELPFLLILFGVLGGIASFGLIGLFIGPVVLAILLTTWREWLNPH